MNGIDIRTRVELRNETQRERVKRGTAGKIALIGAFPSSKQKPFAAESFAQVISHYGVKLNSTDVRWYGGVRAAKRMFMEGIRGYGGANSVTCLNICQYKPNYAETDLDELYLETYEDNEQLFDVEGNYAIDTGSLQVNESTTDRYTPTPLKLQEDTSLTFEKLEKALYSISDEDMDILFIANDLWEILEKPLRVNYTKKDPYKANGNIQEYVLDKDGNKTYDENNKPVTRDKIFSDIDVTRYDKLYEFSDWATNVANKKFKNSVTTEEINANKGMVCDERGFIIYGRSSNGKLIRNIGDVYDYILDFIDNEFTNHRPVNYVGAIKTRATPEGIDNDLSYIGIGSKYLRIFGEKYEDGDLTETNSYLEWKYEPITDEDNESTIFTDRKTGYVSPKDPYSHIKTWGATDIAELFTRTSNELSTCGLFYQRGIINGEEVDEIEFAAHMCGWICSVRIDEDLTYKTIPGVSDINEEPYLGTNDAGTILNQYGIQIIRPKSRLDKTFYVNNSIQPTGWHTNHIRSVTYLLKKLQFESGLGMNNFATNTEAYRTLLDNAAKKVLDECEVIRSVEVGEVQVLSSYHIYVPISIVLSGVITLINIGVSMALDESGTTSTYLKSTSGYSVSL